MKIFKKKGGSKEGEMHGKNLDDFILRQKFQVANLPLSISLSLYVSKTEYFVNW